MASGGPRSLAREAAELFLDDRLRKDGDDLPHDLAPRGRHMPENNLRQAMVPKGASTIPQQPGTAPGLICPIGDKVIFATPGVPYEMEEMVAGTVVPELQRRAGVTAAIRSRVRKIPFEVNVPQVLRASGLSVPKREAVVAGRRLEVRQETAC